MIVQPEFLDHWKTRLLVDITGDQSAPLAVIRLWGYCQTSKHSFFPDMTPAQLSSICHWGDRKPACHVALIRCGFVEKLKPKGFAAHEWSDYNAKLLANWENGKKGGRPRTEEKPNENGQSEKPMGSVGLTQTKPIEQIEQNRTDKMDKIELNGQTAMAPSSGSGSFSSDLVSGSVRSGSVLNPVAQLAQAVAQPKKHNSNRLPTLIQVETLFLDCTKQMKSELGEKETRDLAAKWLTKMSNNGWKDHNNAPVQQWEPLAKAYINGCERRKRDV